MQDSIKAEGERRKAEGERLKAKQEGERRKVEALSEVLEPNPSFPQVEEVL
jgi:hypothetical protein